MAGLRIELVENDVALMDWRHVHNAIVPIVALTVDEVRDRVRRNVLEVMYLQDVLVGCTTVRPPVDGSATATVIVRVLPAYRRRGFGNDVYLRALSQARALGAEEIETVVWASNADGLQFAQARGFAEVSSYLPPGEDVPFLTLRLV